MKKLRNWFIGDYLSKTDNVFERAKITLTYNFAIFFIFQAGLMYINLISHHLLYHIYFVSFGWLSLVFMLYILKTRQNIKLVSQIWVLQFMIIGTGTMLVQGGGTDSMATLWSMVELLFAYFTLGGIWATVVFIHIFGSLLLCIYNEKTHGAFLDFGIPADQKLHINSIYALYLYHHPICSYAYGGGKDSA